MRHHRIHIQRNKKLEVLAVEIEEAALGRVVEFLGETAPENGTGGHVGRLEKRSHDDMMTPLHERAHMLRHIRRR